MPHIGFKKLEKIMKKSGAKNPQAAAASVAYKKYGKKAVQEHAHAGTSMVHVRPKK